MIANRWDTEWLSATVQSIASKYLETLFEINVGMDEAIAHLMSKMPELQSWAEVFVTANPKVFYPCSTSLTWLTSSRKMLS